MSKYNETDKKDICFGCRKEFNNKDLRNFYGILICYPCLEFIKEQEEYLTDRMTRKEIKDRYINNLIEV